MTVVVSKVSRDTGNVGPTEPTPTHSRTYSADVHGHPGHEGRVGDDPGAVERLIRELELGGCQPRPAGDGIWIAACPTCRVSVAEVRVGDDGQPLLTCADAHERPTRTVRLQFIRGAENVVAGWIGIEVPPIPMHRRRPHRKTEARRPRRRARA